MAKVRENTVYQHVLEIRLKDLKMSFIDFRGRITESLIKKLNNIDKFRVTESRIDLLSKDNKVNYFVTVSNFGIQIDNSNSWNEFPAYVKEFLEVLEEIPDYQPRNFIRIGTKTQLLTHRKGHGFDQTKQSFDKKLADSTLLEKMIGGKLIDIGLPLNFESDDGNFNIVSGPMKKNESLQQFFLKKRVGYEDQLSDNGLFLSIDFFNLNPKVKNITEAKEKVFKNLDLMEKKVAIFKRWLLSVE